MFALFFITFFRRGPELINILNLFVALEVFYLKQSKVSNDDVKMLVFIFVVFVFFAFNRTIKFKPHDI